jgi:hypothetical protein
MEFEQHFCFFACWTKIENHADKIVHGPYFGIRWYKNWVFFQKALRLRFSNNKFHSLESSSWKIVGDSCSSLAVIFGSQNLFFVPSSGHEPSLDLSNELTTEGRRNFADDPVRHFEHEAWKPTAAELNLKSWNISSK